MSTIRQYRTIYVVDPVYADDGYSQEITGYNNLRAYNLLAVPASATNDIDVAAYGDNINDIMKFNSRIPVDMLTLKNGGYGIYFTQPTLVEGLYQNPEYLSTPVTVFNGSYFFEGIKQTY